MLKRNGSATWTGPGKNGKGIVRTQSKAVDDVQYSFSSRFENGVGTNPEELIGAAHAGCYSMALSLALFEAGFNSEKIDTQATVTIEPKEGGFEITTVHLKVTAQVPGIDQAKFKEFAEKAKLGCPVSKALKGPQITLEAILM